MRWRLRRRRRAARLVLLDAADRVLLLRLEAGRDAQSEGYWYLPGGGVRPRESVEAAARRELREETGIHDVVLGPIVGQRESVRFVFAGRQIEQDEWYVAARVATGRVGSGRRGDGERRAVAAHRWWSIAELDASDEVVHPHDIVALVREAVAAVPPRRAPGA